MMNREIYFMLRNVMHDTLGLDMQYIVDPTGDLRLIDHGLRESLFGSDGYTSMKKVLASEIRLGNVIHFQDRLHMHYFLFPAHPKKPPYCSIGPFFPTHLSEEDWTKTFADYPLSQVQQAAVREFLPSVPELSVPQVFSVVQNVLLAAYDSMEIQVRVVDMNAAQTEAKKFQILDYAVPRHSPEEIYQLECSLAQAVTEGIYEKSLKLSHEILTALAPDGLCDLREYLGLYHWANALYRKSAQDYGIPPYLVQDLYHKMYLASDGCTTYASYVSLQINMLTAYCDLCREYSTKDYSPVIRFVVNYIRMNLSKELNIQVLAKNAGFSQTYLTHKFKDEVGMPPSKYIQEQRIRLAKKMLASSSKPVSEIAMDVGVTDVSYFSRLFKKCTGQSPSDFRKPR